MSAPGTIVEFVHNLLREEIINGRYPPGTRLNESKIARDHDISRIPVREALVRLRVQGLVMKRDRRGMFVVELTSEEIRRINSVRIILEAEALRLCRRKLNKRQAAKLTRLVEKMENWTGGSQMDAASIDFEFHQTLWSAAGNPYLSDTLESLTTPLFAHTALQHESTEVTRWRLYHHRALLDYVLANSAVSPEEAVIGHLNAYYNEPEKYSSLAEPDEDATGRVQSRESVTRRAVNESRRASAVR